MAYILGKEIKRPSYMHIYFWADPFGTMTYGTTTCGSFVRYQIFLFPFEQRIQRR